MSDHTTAIHEPPPLPRHDTTRSWRVVKSVLVWLLSAITAIVGFFAAYSDRITGNSDAEIAEFETSLRDYIRAATQARHSRISGVEFELYFIEMPARGGLEEQAARLERAVRSLSYGNQDRAKATINQTVAEYNYARSSSQADLRVHSDTSLRALKHDWQKKNTTEALFRGLWVAALSFIGAWIVAWLLVVGLALIWWFMMDRLRDISRAIRGH
jgi:hypothetical protein